MSGQPEFEEYVAARWPALVRTAYLLTGNHHDAEDLVQGALLKAVARWGRIADRPDPYVRRIIANDHVSSWRRRRDREVSMSEPPDATLEGPDGADLVALRDALATLAPGQRAVIVLRYYEGLTEREVAEVLGRSLGTVKSQASDGMRRLREQLGDVGAAELTRPLR
jgi:RNA polymerase sigma-70 factor (sigma-E family)